MNRDDIIRMAEEADAYADNKLGLGEWHPDKHEVRDEHFAKLVAAAEREACAEAAAVFGELVAHVIRARGDK